MAQPSIKKALADSKGELRRQFGIRKMGIFGSYSRGEQRQKSDLDVLAEFEAVPSIFELLRAEKYLSEQLGIKVDLIYSPGLKARFKRAISADLVVV